MRHLIDTYIEAEEAKTISPFDGMGLLELIVKSGIGEATASQLGALSGNRDAIAETIENNVRRRILKEHLSDPAFYAKMSALLDEIIAAGMDPREAPRQARFHPLQPRRRQRLLPRRDDRGLGPRHRADHGGLPRGGDPRAGSEGCPQRGGHWEVLK